jgi:predicted transcriptional regulator
MKLLDYLLEKNENISEFSKRANIERHTVSNFIKGGKCHIKTVHKIMKATDGAVTNKDLIE